MTEYEAFRASGWYPDPWSPDNHRFFTGTEWTADVFPSGPGYFTHPSAPSPLPPTQRSSTPLPPPVWAAERPAPTTAFPAVPLPASLPPGPPGQQWWRRPQALVAAAVALGLVVGIGLTVAFTGGNSNNTATTAPISPSTAPSPPVTQPSIPIPSFSVPSQQPSEDVPSAAPSDSPLPGQGTPPSAGNGSGTTDPTLSKLVLRQSDVTGSLLVGTLDDGDSVSGAATLDVCNGTYPSESLRTARLQVAAEDITGTEAISTEAVRYKSAAAVAQAFSELSSVVKACPSTPVTSPVGEPTVTSQVTAGIDSSWPQISGVTRQAYDIKTVDANGTPAESIGVYLRRGSVLLGVYIPTQSGSEPPSVDGETSVQAIAKIFADRLAALPASSVGS